MTEATGGIDPSVVIAALLHDAIEDQGVTSETLAAEFGQHVADIVLEVTDDKSLPKAERKRLQVTHAPHARWRDLPRPEGLGQQAARVRRQSARGTPQASVECAPIPAR